MNAYKKNLKYKILEILFKCKEEYGKTPIIYILSKKKV